MSEEEIKKLDRKDDVDSPICTLVNGLDVLRDHQKILQEIKLNELWIFEGLPTGKELSQEIEEIEKKVSKILPRELGLAEVFRTSRLEKQYSLAS